MRDKYTRSKKIEKENNLREQLSLLLQRSKIVVGPKISEVQSGVLHPGGWQSEDLKEENVDRGFVLSDHADWDGLVDVIKGTGAEIVKVTHGNGDDQSIPF